MGCSARSLRLPLGVAARSTLDKRLSTIDCKESAARRSSRSSTDISDRRWAENRAPSSRRLGDGKGARDGAANTQPRPRTKQELLSRTKPAEETGNSCGKQRSTRLKEPPRKRKARAGGCAQTDSKTCSSDSSRIHLSHEMQVATVQALVTKIQARCSPKLELQPNIVRHDPERCTFLRASERHRTTRDPSFCFPCRKKLRFFLSRKQTWMDLAQETWAQASSHSPVSGLSAIDYRMQGIGRAALFAVEY